MSSPENKEQPLSPPTKQIVKRALPSPPIKKSPSASEQSPNVTIQPKATPIQVVTIQPQQSIYGKIPSKRENENTVRKTEGIQLKNDDTVVPENHPAEPTVSISVPIQEPQPQLQSEQIVSSSPPTKGKVPYGKIPISQIQERIKLQNQSSELRTSSDKENDMPVKPPTPSLSEDDGEVEEKPSTPPSQIQAPIHSPDPKPSPYIYGKLPSRSDLEKMRKESAEQNSFKIDEVKPSPPPSQPSPPQSIQPTPSPLQNIPEKKSSTDHYAKIPQLRFSKDEPAVSSSPPVEPARKSSNDGSHYAAIPKITKAASAQSVSQAVPLSESPPSTNTKTYRPPIANENTTQAKHYQSIPKIFSDEEAKRKQLTEKLEQMRQNDDAKRASSGSVETKPLFRTTVDDLSLREQKQNLMKSTDDRGRGTVRAKSIRSGSVEAVSREKEIVSPDRNSKTLVRRLSARIIEKLDSLKMSRKLSALDPEEKDNLAKFMADYPHLFEEEKSFLRADHFSIYIHDQVDSSKSTLYELSVQKVKNLTKNKDYYVFLFSDVMILTRKKPFKGMDFKLKSKLPLQHCRLIMVGNDEKYKNSFQLTYVNTTYTLTPKRNHEEIKNTWFKEIKAEIKKYQKEKAEQQKRIQDDKRSSVIVPTPVQLKPEDYNAKMVSILEDDNLAQYFREFLHQEYNNENFSFWLEVEDFRKHTPDWSIPVRSEEIYNNYLKPDAPKEVNIDSQSKVDVMKAMANKETLSRNVFDKAQSQVFTLMATDCVPRFYKSQLYQDYQADMQGGKKRFIQRSDTQVMLRHYVMEKKKEEEKK